MLEPDYWCDGTPCYTDVGYEDVWGTDWCYEDVWGTDWYTDYLIDDYLI